MIRIRPVRVLALLVLLACLSGLAVLVPTAPASAAGGLTVTVGTVSPAVLRPDTGLVLSGTVTNTTDAELTDLSVFLRLQRRPAGTVAALDDWLTGAQAADGKTTYVQSHIDLGAPIPPGQSVPWTLELPAGQTGFDDATSWGPRGAEITIENAAASGSARTMVVFFPTQSPLENRAEVSVIAPLTPTATEWAAAIEGSGAGDAAAARLGPVLEALAPTPVAAAVDPALLDPLGPQGTADSGDLAARLAGFAKDRDVIALDYAAVDRHILAAAPDLVAAGDERGAALFAETGIDALDGVAWPQGTASSAVLDALVGGGAKAVVLGERTDPGAAQPGTEPLGARISLERRGRTATGLVGSADLREALLTPIANPTDRQRLLAVSALLADAADQRSDGILVTLPTDLDGDEAGRVAAALTELAQAPWAATANLRSLLGRTDDAPAGSPELAPRPASGLTKTQVDQLVAAAAGLGRIAGVTADPGAFEAQYLPGLLVPAAAAWDGAPAASGPALANGLSRVNALTGRIAVARPSTVNLITRAGPVPITVTNDLPVEVTVRVELASDDPLLRPEGPQQVTVPANGSAEAKVQLTAIKSGDVTVTARVVDAKNQDVAEPVQFPARVRADWEDTGTAIVAGILVVLLVWGIVRTTRRHRRNRAADQQRAEDRSTQG